MHSNTTLLNFNRQWSEVVYQQEGAMTKDEFLSWAYEYLYGEGVECLCEHISEIQGEINMFGDSGPGTMYHLTRQVGEYNRVGQLYSKLSGTTFRPLRLPTYRY